MSPRLRLQPALLALGMFLGTLPPYAPNFRLYARFAVDVDALSSHSLAMVVTIGLVGLGCAASSLRRPAWRGFGRPALWGAAAGYMVDFAALMACVYGGAPAAWAPGALGVVAGVCAVPLVFGWIACFPGDLRSSLLHAGLAVGVAAVTMWALGYIPGAGLPFAASAAAAVGVAVPAALAPVSGRARPCKPEGFSASAGERGAAPAGSGALGLARNLLSIVWVPFLGFLVFVFITSGYRFPEGLVAVDTEITGALLALAVVLAVGLPRCRTPLVLVVEKIAMPACVALSVVLGGFPSDTPLFFAGAASVFAPLIFMGVYAGALLAVVSKGDEFPVAFTVGLALFLTCAASMLGVATSSAVQIDMGPWAWVVICAYFGLIVVDLGVSSWRRIARPSTEAVPELQVAGVGEAVEDQVKRRVQELSRACDLSGREEEILGYLARGYNSTYIAKALFISANTVRSHSYNLYRKLGIASRGELLELVNGSGPIAREEGA